MRGGMRPEAEASGYLILQIPRRRGGGGDSANQHLKNEMVGNRICGSRTLAAMAKMKPMKAAVAQSLVQLAGGGPPAEMVFGDWYPALRATGLKRGDTSVTTLLGIPMLVGRKSDGVIFAMRDLCPHRGIPLSAGWFDGETVQCK